MFALSLLDGEELDLEVQGRAIPSALNRFRPTGSSGDLLGGKTW